MALKFGVLSSFILLSRLAFSNPFLPSFHPLGQHPLPGDQNTIATNSIRDVLISNSVIGNVLDDFEPKFIVSISYPSSHESVKLGNDIPVSSVDSRPMIEFHSLEPPTVEVSMRAHPTFTLALTDPDARSRKDPDWSEMCHWIMTNLTSSTSRETESLSLKEGELIEYLPPSPPPKTGKHRYVFVLLKGHTSTLNTPKDRKHWGYGKVRHGVQDWANENKLEVVGANFFFAENEKQ